MEQKLYIGTCRAFVEYAKQRGNQFGPDGTMWFTPDLAYAQEYANSWKTKAGKTKLVEYFGEKLPEEYSQGIVLEWDTNDLGNLKEDSCWGQRELSRNGPVKLGRMLRRS